MSARVGSFILVFGALGGCREAPELEESSESLTTTTLTASGDTYLRGGGQNQNQGTELLLRIQSSGPNRALVRFDQAAIAGSIGVQRVVASARLDLVVSSNGSNWGTTGRTIDVDRVTAPWTELGATWNCGIDTNTANQHEDCPTTAWIMSGSTGHPWIEPPTATALITNTTAAT